ncbi:MAG: glycosyltransferase family 2 protein [Planctomycetaceae bacterium]
MTDQRPLLSICIPTCNRAGFLRVMLQALLPQVRQFPDEVEVWVLDNASTDQTAQVLADSAELGPFRVHRHGHNIGPTRNIVYGPATLASGCCVWVLGDHNLLLPNALRRVVECIRSHPAHDFFYVNFRVALYPSQWPAAALAGHDGEFAYLGNAEVSDGVVSHWHQLLRPMSAVCTQSYVHIVRTQIWREFWRHGVSGEDYSSALTTYPHTMTIVASGLQSPAVVVADAAITIFNGAQWWGNPVTRAKVYFIGLPQLLKELKYRGVCRDKVDELIDNFHVPEATRVIRDACREHGRARGLRIVFQNLGTSWLAYRVFLGSLPEILLPRATQAARQLSARLRGYRSWYLFNFRPARWLRSLGSANCGRLTSVECDGKRDTD